MEHPRDPVREALWEMALRAGGAVPPAPAPAAPQPPENMDFDRREILTGGARLFLGGVLGGLLATSLQGCRTPMVFRDPPTGVPTGYIIDPAICTHHFDCERICPCGAIGFTEEDAAEQGDKEGGECRTCWVNLDKCCACGRCYRVCPDNAVVPCYGEDKIPAREIGRAPSEEKK